MIHRATFECKNHKIVNTCNDHRMKLHASLPATTHWLTTHSIIIGNMKFMGPYSSFNSIFSSGKCHKCNGLAWHVCWHFSHWAFLGLGRRVLNRVPLPANVVQLSQMLIQEWNNIPQLRIQNVIQSMNASSLSSVHSGKRWSWQILTILQLLHIKEGDCV